MTQELINLRESILEGRYTDALAIVDELDWMSRKGTIRQIKSFLLRILIHLIKNQVEQRLTNSWAASIHNSVVEIQELNLQENQASYYIKLDEWQTILADVIELAIRDASVEVLEGMYSPFQLLALVNRTEIISIAENLLALTYEYDARKLPAIIDEKLTLLPGGEDWKFGKR